MTDRIVGVILAGGLATRMGGGDKCLKELGDGTTLLDIVISRVNGQVDDLALNANGNSDRFSHFNLPVLPDAIEGYAGPLAGILAGLTWAEERGATHVLSVAGDTPFFPLNLAEQLTQNGSIEGLSIAASSDNDGKLWRQPTFGLWPVALKDDLRRALTEDGIRKIVVWTNKHGAGQAFFESDDGLDPFFNVNTPDDLDRARQIARQRDMV
ncbi:MAG: molybdenum cofactor guanylyltransferase MobA [Paracoccaceae bacterium]|nr:molybdenum cofactor guanylyltransferase MobA [Paracoccaceae bacterium]MDG2257162.1 molybdenum cofactor guanylyltransferase MobA [Paracoccaceae bacterium]